MPRSDLLLNLVKASSVGDQRLLRSTVEAIATEERAKQHNILADRLMRALDVPNSPNSPHQRAALPIDTAGLRARDYFSEVVPRRSLEELVLTEPARTACEQLLEEQRRADLLRSHGLEPRHRILLVGPPGNGKTTLAEAIADGLGSPLLVVRYEAMIGSYLGETAARLRRVFDYARTTSCVLFFDEFDAVGKERGDVHETGEIKRVVTSLLMQVDDLPSYTVVVAATNHAELLDRAVWRRFQLRLEMPAPSVRDLARFIDRYTSRFEEPWGVSPESVARALGAVSYAEAEEFCLDVLRRCVLTGGEKPLKQIVQDQLRLWAARVSAAPGERKGRKRVARTSAAETSRAD